MTVLSPAALPEYLSRCAWSLEFADLDLWALSARLTPEERDALRAVLSDGEWERASRFHFEADRDRSIAARGSLRQILSAYSGVPARQLAFDLGRHGKPKLHDDAIKFNVSHSGDVVLVGVLAGGECGVDIERVRPPRSGISDREVAERFFSSLEVQWLRDKPGDFLRIWVAKEAVVKALGCGLSMPLSAVDVTDVLDGRAASVMIAGQEFWVREFSSWEGYRAAVAAGLNPGRLRVLPQ